jgi:hypothetical protein
MDNHSIHNSPEILRLYCQDGVVSIWLRLHSTHCLQPLDLYIFGSFKSRYANLHTRSTSSQLEGKLLRTLHVWHLASYAGVMCSAWKLGAPAVKRLGDPHHPGVVNIRTLVAIMRKAHSNAREWFARSERQQIKHLSSSVCRYLYVFSL